MPYESKGAVNPASSMQSYQQIVVQIFDTVKVQNFRMPENCRNLPKNQTKRPTLKVFHLKDANGIANSEDHDQTAPLGAV